MWCCEKSLPQYTIFKVKSGVLKNLFAHNANGAAKIPLKSIANLPLPSAEPEFMGLCNSQEIPDHTKESCLLQWEFPVLHC